MLLLTRRPTETIVIGDFIRVTVRSICDHKVKLAIEAPDEILVYREEVYERILKERKRRS